MATTISTATTSAPLFILALLIIHHTKRNNDTTIPTIKHMTMNPLALLRAVLATLAATAATAATLRDFREEPAPNADAPGPAADGRDVEGLPAALGADPQDVPNAPEDALAAKFDEVAAVAAGHNPVARLSLQTGDALGNDNVSLIKLYFSHHVDNSETNDAPNLKIRWEHDGYPRTFDAGRMSCGVEPELIDWSDRIDYRRSIRCRSAVIFTDYVTAIDYIEVEATGGDAMMIDHAQFGFVRPSHPEQFKTWGTSYNNYAWCVSTQSNDFDDSQYRIGSACRCKYQFHWDNTNSAYYFPCSGTEEGRLAVEPGR